MKRPVAREMRDIANEMRRTSMHAAMLADRHVEAFQALVREHDDEIRELWREFVGEVGVRQARRRCPRIAQEMRAAAAMGGG